METWAVTELVFLISVGLPSALSYSIPVPYVVDPEAVSCSFCTRVGR